MRGQGKACLVVLTTAMVDKEDAVKSEAKLLPKTCQVQEGLLRYLTLFPFLAKLANEVLPDFSLYQILLTTRHGPGFLASSLLAHIVNDINAPIGGPGQRDRVL